MEEPDLRIVVEDARVDDRVLERLEDVVEVPSAAVGRVAVGGEADRPPEPRAKVGEAAHDHHPVPPPLAAYQHPVAKVSIIPVDRGRPGEVERDAPAQRAHGAAPVPAAQAAGEAAGAADGAACEPDFAA